MPRNETRDDYKYFLKIPTRWMDNDIYGHVNNVVYYSYVDTVSNAFLIEEGGLDIHNDPVIGIAVESHCNFYRSLEFPESVDAGLRVGHLGRSSVRYEIGLFSENSETICAAAHFVHVFVDRDDRRPRPMPDSIRVALEAIHVGSASDA